jgi:DNA-binding MarR family transcriptional regulator
VTTWKGEPFGEATAMVKRAKPPKPDGRLTAGSEFYESAGHQVRRAHQIATALFAEELARYDLTPLQFAALTAIASAVDSDATRISRIVALDRSTLGNVLERIESKGWIAREYRSTDKRTKRLALTPAGRALLKEVAPAIKRSRAAFLDVLKPNEANQLRKLLSKLIALHAADEERFEGGR